jgi:hypothetical protein
LSQALTEEEDSKLDMIERWWRRNNMSLKFSTKVMCFGV